MWSRIVRYTLAGVALVTLLAGVAIGLLFLYLPGSGIDGDVVAGRIEARLAEILGDAHEVKIGSTQISFPALDELAINATDLKIVRKSDGQTVSSIGLLGLTGRTTEIVSDVPAFETVLVEGVVVHDDAFIGSANTGFPKRLADPVIALGTVFAGIGEQFNKTGLHSVLVRDVEMPGRVLGGRGTQPLRIGNISIEPNRIGGFDLNADVASQFSRIDFASSFHPGAESGADAVYRFNADGLSLLEWFSPPDVSEGYLGFDSSLQIAGSVSMGGDGQSIDPELNIKVAPGLFRIGHRSVTTVEELDLNLRLFPDRNQIELESSPVSIGGFNARLEGGIKPVSDDAGYHGPLLYDLIFQHATFRPTRDAEEVKPAAFKLAGVYDHAGSTLRMDNVLMVTREGRISGSGELGLEDASPSIRMDATTEGISVAALKQFWPFFVAGAARKWVHDHVHDGWVNSGLLKADIPAGVIFNLRNGATLTPDQYQVDLNLEKFEFRPFGELPNITGAKGRLNLSGTKLQAFLDEGESESEGDGSVKIFNGRFEMPDYSAFERSGEVNVELDGGIRAIASIAESKPLRVMDRLNVVPEQFSGKGHANIAAKFPVGRHAEYEEVEWNVLLETKKGTSSRKLGDYVLSDADVLIDANPYGAQVTGKMKINGVSADINFVEPIGRTGRIKTYRKISANLTEKERKALGVDLAPVVAGPVDMLLEQKEDRQTFSLDFGQTELALPWIGWSKGAGIRSKGQFVLKRANGVSTLEDFSITGPGFLAKGRLALDKRGLLSADLDQLRLNDGDEIAFRLRRSKDGYDINASGLRYDARAVINSLVHQGSFSEAQGKRSVTLTANFETVTGFGKQEMKNAVVLYESRNGRLSRLDLRGEASNDRRFNVTADLRDGKTRFDVRTNDAGTALAFMNIYSKMRDGVMNASLTRGDDGAYRGPVRLENFSVVNEPKLKRMASNVRYQIPDSRGDTRRKILPDGEDRIVNFLLADARIERGEGFFNVQDAVVRSATMGIAMEGKVYDERDRMDLTGTFMPANAVNLAVSTLPLLNQLLSDGRRSALIGITYRLKGPRSNPELQLNPLSAVAPGVFKRIFEFQR